MEPWINNFAAVLCDLLVKSVILIAFAALVTACLNKASASLRHIIWVAVFVCLIAMPVLSAYVPRHQVDGWPQVVGQTNETSHTAVTTFVVEDTHRVLTETGSNEPYHTPASSLATAVSTPAAASTAPHASVLAVLLSAIWLVGALATACHVIVGNFRIRAIASFGQPIPEMDLDVIVSARRAFLSITVLHGAPHTKGLSPMTWGVLRPVVLMHFGAEECPLHRRRSALTHEFAHILRRDWLWQIIAAIATSVYWVNPLVHWAAKRMIDESERACDDLVINQGVTAVDYAQDLLETARLLRKQPATGAVSMARKPQIEWRLRFLLSKSIDHRPAGLRAIAVALLGALFIILPLSAVTRSKDDLAKVLRHFSPGDTNPKRLANISLLQRAILRFGNADPEAGKAHLALANEEIAANRFKDAAADFDTAAKLPDPQGNVHIQAYQGRLEALERDNNLAAAAAFAANLQKNPDAVEIWGEVKRDEALDLRLASLQTDGGLSDAMRRYRDYQRKELKATGPALSKDDMLELAQNLDEAGKHKEAIEVYDDFLKSYPKASEAADASVERDAAVYGLGRVPSATIVAIMTKYPSSKSDANMYNELGMAYEGENNLLQASEAYDKGFEIGSDNFITPNVGEAYIRTLTMLNRITERDAAVAELLRRFPNSTVSAKFRSAETQQPETPVPTGTVVPASWTLHAPGNVTVDLVKVATAWNSPCWKPDGTTLPHNPGETNVAFMEKGTNYGLLFRITTPLGTEKNPVTISQVLPAASGGWTSYVGDDKVAGSYQTLSYWDGETSMVPLPDRIDLPLYVRCGNWTTAAVIPTSSIKSQGATIDGFTLNLNAPSTNAPDQGVKCWAITDHLGNLDRRVTVVELDGHTQSITQTGSQSDDKSSTTWFTTPSIPLNRIREIHVETRPYFKAMFRNIHLKPDTQTPGTASAAHII
jgi:beta-lactamase regulating signal transducer with metallopeptidase domain